MRLYVICLMLFYCRVAALAQSADFLQGVWLSSDGKQTTEFHWATEQGKPALIGRNWSGNAQACPWCVTQLAMAIFVDSDSHQIRLHMRDQVQGARDFHLVTARKRYIEFAAEDGRVIEFQCTRPDLLSIRFGEQTLLLHRQ